MKNQPLGAPAASSCRSSSCRRFLLGLGTVLVLLTSVVVASLAAQQTEEPSNKKEDQNAGKSSVEETLKRLPSDLESVPGKLRRQPIEWLIGPYIPVQARLEPLTLKEREQVYFRRTFLTVGSYLARGFSAGVDQARDDPYKWGGGMPGYGKRYVARYGEFVVQNTMAAAGDAAVGYEPRYDFCRCIGFWPRTRHAISRNFLSYNRSESELRPQIPTYAAAFTAGTLYGTWLPGHHNIWRSGALSVVSQAGAGSGYNFVSEFALDILRKFGGKK
jgi:hypothetical protein